MGLAVAASGDSVRSWFVYSHLFDALEHMPFRGENAQSFYSVVLGDTAYTPDDLENYGVVEGDRPYANLTFLSSAETRAYEASPDSGAYAISNTLVIGIIGADIGKATQRKLHNDWGLSNQSPNGWTHQISDGGELTALWNHSRKYLTWEGENLPMDLTTYIDGDLGYYIDAGAGLSIRIGRRASPYWSSSFNPLSKYNHAAMATEKDFYFFAGIGARAFAYNALLQGQFRDSDYTLSYREIKPFQLEGTLGFSASLTKDICFRYAINYRSSEMDVEPGDRPHIYGGIYLDVVTY